MSAESDLLFPNSDALALPDVHLCEFDDFAKDFVLQGNAIEGIPAQLMHEELNKKDHLKQLSLTEFNAFSTVLDEEVLDEEKDVKVDPTALLLQVQNGSENSPTTSFGLVDSNTTDSNREAKSPRDGLSNGSVRLTGEASSGALSPRGLDQVEMPSPRTRIATSKLNQMSLNEGVRVPFLPVLSQAMKSDESSFFLPPLLTPILVSSGGAATVVSTPDLRIFSAQLPSISPLASAAPLLPGCALESSTITHVPRSLGSSRGSVTSVPSGTSTSLPFSTRSPSDGSCSHMNATSPGKVKNLLNGMLLQENSFKNQHGNCSNGHPSLTDRSGVFGRHTPRVDPSGHCRGPIPPHVLQESSQLPIMQRSLSSNALGQLRSVVHPNSGNDDVMITKIPILEAPMVGISTLHPYSPPSNLDLQGINIRPAGASMRRVYSTGDLQGPNSAQIASGGSSPLTLERSNVEEGTLKVGQYTLEERKMRLHRYRQKRTERNFNRKIKYACRKTLADSRPRIRGRFARTDDIGETAIKMNGIQHDEEEEEGDTMLEVEDHFLMRNGPTSDFWDMLG